MSMNCAFIENIDNPNLLGEISNLTVGQKFYIKCSHNFTLDLQNLQIFPIENQKSQVPAIQLLQVLNTSNETNLDLVVASYQVGTFNLSNYKISDGKQNLNFNSLQWSVSSVQQGVEEGQQVEAYPSYPYEKLSYPLWFYSSLAVGLILFFLIPYLIIKKIHKRKKAYDDIENFTTVQLPLDAFYKEMRKIEKQIFLNEVTEKEILENIEQQIRLYLTRELIIPAYMGNIYFILKELKRKHYRIFKLFHVQISQLFKELQNQKIQRTSISYFIDKSQSLVEQMDAEIQKKKKSRIHK